MRIRSFLKKRKSDEDKSTPAERSAGVDFTLVTRFVSRERHTAFQSRRQSALRAGRV